MEKIEKRCHLDFSEVRYSEYDDLNPEQTKEFYQKNFPYVIDQAGRMVKNETEEVVDLLMKEIEGYKDAWEGKDENPEQFAMWVKYKKNKYKSHEIAEKIRYISCKDKKSDKDKNEIKKLSVEFKIVLGVLFELRLQQ